MGRGPSYPYIGLEEAIGQARKVYDYAKRGAAACDSVVTEGLKYSATSSSGEKVLAALRAFGLTEDAQGSNGKSLKLTQRAIRILLDDQNSTERQEEIRKAAISPKWYEYCWKKWGAEMPPAMRSNLLIEHGFIESTVDGFLKNYKASIAFAGLPVGSSLEKTPESDDQSNYRPSVGDYVQWESQGMLRMPAARKLDHYSPKGDFAFVEGFPTGIPVGELIAGEPPEKLDEPFVPPPNIFSSAVSKPATATAVAQGGMKTQIETFALPEGVVGQLQWPDPMSEEAYKDFLHQLEGVKMRVNRAVRKDTIPAPDVPSQNEGREG